MTEQAAKPAAPNEPSQPTQRKEEGLPAKSYADAADDAPHNGVSKKANGVKSNAGSQRGRTKAHPTKDPASAKVDKSHDLNRANGVHIATANVNGNNVLEKEYELSDGQYLTSTKASAEYYATIKQGEKEEGIPANDKTNRMEKDELVSGRQAGARWQQSAIRWAPLSVPLQRRLQTFAILFHTLCIAAMLTLFLLLCTIPLLWPILIPYLIYTLLSTASTSGELSHRSEWMRRSSFWSLLASYFPARLHRSVELPPTRKYIFGYHPHGIISHGAFAAFGTEALGFSSLFPGITNTLLTLDANFRVPLYRDYALGMGLASVSRESCQNLLSKGGINGEGMGRAITIVVGGARESLDAQPHVLRLVLKRRKGFVKMAIRNGADLVPVVGFGENDLYEQFQADEHPYIHKTQMLFKKFLGFTVPLFHARGIFNYDVGLLPYRRPVNVVVGRPIHVETQSKPTEEYIDLLHQQYENELQRLWDQWKDTFAKDRIEELQIIE